MHSIVCPVCSKTMVTLDPDGPGKMKLNIPKGGAVLRVREKGSDKAAWVCGCGGEFPISLSEWGLKPS